MKKFLIFLIGFVFLGLVVFAQMSEENFQNFQKAGEVELAKREAVLSQKKAEIEKFFDGMPSDVVIAGKEMKTLKKKVGDFDKTQKQFNKELEFYGLKTITVISPIICELLDVYYGNGKNGNDSLLNYTDNSQQIIRHFFTQKTGQDIRVEKSKDYVARFLLGFIVGLLAAWVCFMGLVVCDIEDIRLLYFGSITFALVLIAFLFLL